MVPIKKTELYLDFCVFQGRHTKYNPYTRTRACTYTHIQPVPRLTDHTPKYTHIHIYTCIPLAFDYVHALGYTHAYNTQTHMHTNTQHTHIHTYIHTYTHPPLAHLFLIGEGHTKYFPHTPLIHPPTTPSYPHRFVTNANAPSNASLSLLTMFTPLDAGRLDRVDQCGI